METSEYQQAAFAAQAAADRGLTNQPDAATAIREDLATKHADIMKRAAELLAAAERVPAEIADDEIAGKVGDFIKQVSACAKNAEAARVSEKEPHLAAGRMVDGWFKGLADPLDKAKAKIQNRLTDYLRAKEAKERAERERIAREERDAAAAAAKLAQQAEQAVQSAAGLDAAIDAAEVANKAAADAAQAERAADAKAADLSRTRGDFGSVASLRDNWTFRALDRASLDLEVLRSHLSTDALEHAMRSFVRAGGRQIKGATIYNDQKASVR